MKSLFSSPVSPPLTAVAGAMALAACADKTPGADMEFKTVDYQCEGDVRLQVQYGNPDTGPGTAALSYQGKLISMHQEPAASGALYVADKNQPLYRWHTKGNEGMLSLQSLGNGEEEILLKNCQGGG